MNLNPDGKVETRKKTFLEKNIIEKKQKLFFCVLVLHMPVLPIPKMEKQTSPNVHHTNQGQIKKNFYGSITDLCNIT